MKINTFGSKSNPPIILLHGGGLSFWSITYHIEELSKDYYVIAPIIDGHGSDCNTTFVSIMDTANKIVEYIDAELDGKIHAIWGLSIGAQITVEILSRAYDITEYAIVESALVIPIKSTAKLAKITYNMTYPLIKKKWFAQLQSKSLFIPEDMFANYYNDSSKMSKETLINITLSNGSYSIPETLENTNAKALIAVGSKELNIMKKSAQLLNSTIKDSQLLIMQNSGHGQLSMQNPASHLDIIKNYISGNY